MSDTIRVQFALVCEKKNRRGKYGWNPLFYDESTPTYRYTRLFPTSLPSFLSECGVLTTECHISCHSYRDTTGVTAVFTRFTLHSFERKESRRGYKRKFYSPYLFFPLFGLTYNTRSSKSETAIRNNLRDYLSRRNGGAEGNRAQAGDCVRETCTDWLVSCQSLERRMCVSRGTNSRVSADDRCVSVARLEKAVPRTTRKLFTAHLSRPRSRCTSHVYVYWRIAKILATTSKYSVARTPYLRHGDFSSRTESQLERDICHKSRKSWKICTSFASLLPLRKRRPWHFDLARPFLPTRIILPTRMRRLQRLLFNCNTSYASNFHAADVIGITPKRRALNEPMEIPGPKFRYRA